MINLIIVLVLMLLMITVLPMILGNIVKRLFNTNSRNFINSYSDNAKDERIDDNMIANLAAMQGQFRGKF